MNLSANQSIFFEHPAAATSQAAANPSLELPNGLQLPSPSSSSAVAPTTRRGLQQTLTTEGDVSLHQNPYPTGGGGGSTDVHSNAHTAVDATLAHPAAEAYNRIGRHPSLELRHTVDDNIQVASRRDFLTLRAFLHRQGDTLIAYSDVVRIVGSHPSGSGTDDPLNRKVGLERALIFTDRHMYVTMLPTSAIFAPARSGSCFPWKEFSKACTVPDSHHVIFQFIGCVAAVIFGNKGDVERCGKHILSLTGSPLERLSDQDILINQSRHFARDSKRLNVAVVNTHEGGHRYRSREAAAKQQHQAPPPPPGSIASSEEFAKYPDALSAHEVRSNASSAGGGRKQVLPPTSEGGYSAAVPDSVENMLRFVLGRVDNEGNSYESMFPSVGIQVAPQMSNRGVQQTVQVVDRATSPVLMPGSHGGGGHGLVGDVEQTSTVETDSAATSEFDAGEVWTHLTRTPSKYTSAPAGASGLSRGGGGGGKASMRGGSHHPHHHGSSSHVDPTATTAGTRSHTPTSSKLFASHHQGGGAALAVVVGGPTNTSFTSDHRGGAGGSTTGTVVTNASIATPPMTSTSAPSPSATGGGGGGGAETADHGAPSLARTMSNLPRPLSRKDTQSPAAPDSGSGSKGGEATTSSSGAAFSTWLGILSAYQAAFQEAGFDSASKFVRLGESELETLCERCGVVKHGHVVLLQSKVALLRQANNTAGGGGGGGGGKAEGRSVGFQSTKR